MSIRPRPPLTPDLAREAGGKEDALKPLRVKAGQWRAALDALAEARLDCKADIKFEVRGRECWPAVGEVEEFCHRQLRAIDDKLSSNDQAAQAPAKGALP